MDQHYVPEMHLKRFVGTQPPGHVWTYDAIKEEVRSSIPKETGFQRHFYSVQKEDGTMDTRIESFLSEFETRAGPVYENLLNGELPENQQKAHFSEFLALSYSRTPTMRRINGELYGRSMQSIAYAYGANPSAFDKFVEDYEKKEGKLLDKQEKEKLRQSLIDPSAYIQQVSKEKTLDAIGLADKLAPMFYNMDWTLLIPSHGFFITSDNPLLRQIHYSAYHPIYGDGGFANKTARVTFPLSPKLMLLLTWKKNSSQIINVNRNFVDQINAARSSHSERYLYAHIKHKNILKLAVKYKDTRPEFIVDGLRPEKFAEVQIPRKWS